MKKKIGIKKITMRDLDGAALNRVAGASIAAGCNTIVGTNACATCRHIDTCECATAAVDNTCPTGCNTCLTAC